MLEGWNIEPFIAWMNGLGMWAIAASIAVNIIISVAGVIPSVWLTGVNVLVFGWQLGFIISLAGETVGAVVSLIIYRRGLSKIPSVKEQRWGWLQRLHQHGRMKQAGIVLLARLIPLVPSGAVNGIAALSSIRVTDFALMTLIGKMPSIWIEGVVGEALFTNSTLFQIGLTVFIIGIIIWWLRKDRSQKHSR